MRVWHIGAVLMLSLACAPGQLPHLLAAPAPEPSAAPLEAIEARLARLTLEEKVGQLMMVGFAGQAVDDGVARLLQGWQVGGVCLFRRNLAGAAQAARLNDELRALFDRGIPPFLALDQEGGNVVRIDDGNLVLPGNMLLGASRDPALAYEAGLRQAQDLYRLGFNMNLAPVLDVNSNPRNPVIGLRAFGGDSDLVSELGARFVAGQQAAGIATVAKHFPGHGAVEVDSHRDLPVVRQSPARVQADLKPFVAAAAVGLDGMMTAHVVNPGLSDDALPATLSEGTLGGVLRGQLNFDGLVLTDELEMHAIDRHFGVGQAAVMAVQAGADMVLVPWQLDRKTEVYEALLAAARSGALTGERLDQAVRRILVVKYRRGLFEPLAPREARLAALGSARGLADRIAHAGVTLVRAAEGFPLDHESRIALITSSTSLTQAIAARVEHLVTLPLPPAPAGHATAALKRQVHALATRAEVTVVGVESARDLELVTVAASAGRPVVVVLMGPPYLYARLPERHTSVLLVYSNRRAATAAAADALLGERGTPGHLPVALPGAPLGFGLDPVGARTARRAAASAAPMAGRARP